MQNNYKLIKKYPVKCRLNLEKYKMRTELSDLFVLNYKIFIQMRINDHNEV